MGCAINKAKHRIVDSSAGKFNNDDNDLNSNYEIFNSAQNIINLFPDTSNLKPKCIFIFGGSGSNKGEFIYELMYNQLKREKLDKNKNREMNIISEEEEEEEEEEENEDDDIKINDDRNESKIIDTLPPLPSPTPPPPHNYHLHHYQHGSKRNSVCSNKSKNDNEEKSNDNLSRKENFNKDDKNADYSYSNNDDNDINEKDEEKKLRNKKYEIYVNEKNEENENTFKNNQINNDRQQQNNPDESNDFEINYEYYYIDAELLIISHIKERINRLTNQRRLSIDHDELFAEKSHSIMKKDHNNCNDNSINKQMDCDDQSYEQSNISTQLLKQYINQFGNIVTINWLMNLIEKEIEKQWNSQMKPEKIFLISLIPNRINIFRPCIYLRQTPNFSHLNINYIAINLIKINEKRKDLDIIATNTVQNEEFGENFLNYFRNFNRLIEIKIQKNFRKQIIKLTQTKQAIKINSFDELKNFLQSRKNLNTRETIELNICGFYHENLPVNEKILFLINDQIDLRSNEIIKIEDDKLDVNTIRAFISCYTAIKRSLI